MDSSFQALYAIYGQVIQILRHQVYVRFFNLHSGNDDTACVSMTSFLWENGKRPSLPPLGSMIKLDVMFLESPIFSDGLVWNWYGRNAQQLDVPFIEQPKATEAQDPMPESAEVKSGSFEEDMILDNESRLPDAVIPPSSDTVKAIEDEKDNLINPDEGHPFNGDAPSSVQVLADVAGDEVSHLEDPERDPISVNLSISIRCVCSGCGKSLVEKSRRV